MDTTLRKAAILIDSLDVATAGLLLDRMPPAEAARIHEARKHLDDVSAVERRRVFREFNDENAGDAPGTTAGADDQQPAALRLLPADSPDELATAAEHEPDKSSRPFEFLADAETDSLARHLAGEDSYKAAIVLCHLPPPQSAEILKQLPDSKRVDVVIRMSGIDELAPDVIDDIQNELQELKGKRNSGTGFDAVLSIMNSVDTWSRTEMIGQLRSQHHELADQLKESIDRQPAPETDTPDVDETTVANEVYSFDDLVQLDAASLALLIERADAEEVLLALTGAAPWMVNRLLGQLPARDEKRLRQKMDRCGPLTLKDIEVAQQQLVQLTAQLASEGKITPPARRPFTSLV